MRRSFAIHLVLRPFAFAPLFSLAADSALAAPWNLPERITFNSVQDRTTSGSLMHDCFGLASAVWMRHEPGLGWQVMWAERDGTAWTTPTPIDPGMYGDVEPRHGSGQIRVAWQRGTGDAAEVVHAEYNGVSWNVETLTANATPDVTPALPRFSAFGTGDHVVWAGFDSTSASGKIFHAENTSGEWQVEVLSGSDPGPFWQGAAPKISVRDGLVHVTYRGGDFGNYHLHYARREAGVWSYQIVTSPNGNDLITDVFARNGDIVYVAMSGSDGFGFPNRIYVRTSTDGGQTFFPAALSSGAFSAELGNMIVGVQGIAVAGSETSGNFYTGNVIYATEFGDTEIIPPFNFASERPCAGQSQCIPFGGAGPGLESVLYTNDGGFGPDSAEVYFLASPGIVGGVDPVSELGNFRAMPNPFSDVLRIELTARAGSQLPVSAEVYDATGRRVRVLAEGAPSAARLEWNGTNSTGEYVPAGVYFVRVREGDAVSNTRRVVRLR